MSTPFEPNPAFLAELEALPGLRAAKRDVAKAIVAGAQAIAATSRDTGHYGRNVRWVDRPDVTAAAALDIAAHLIEFGSVFNPAYSPLRLGARATGVRFVPAAKA